MALLVSCPDCDKKFNVKAEMAGKKVRCPACTTIIPVPAKSNNPHDDDYSDEETIPRRKRSADDFDDDSESSPQSRKSNKRKKSGRVKSSGTNWMLVGGLAGGGLVTVLFAAMLIASMNQARKNLPSNAAPASAVLPVPATPAGTPATATVGTGSYLDRLATFKTKLNRQGPSPQPFQNESPPPGVEQVTYQSGPLKLKAWFALPKGMASGSKVPAVVYFHGGFAFGADDFKDAQPFLKAGYAVMCPTLRGENGNPGKFELYVGEVDDAKAAIAWLGAHNSVDASHMYTFGHSAGGVLSALLSLHDVPIRHGGSSGGLYGPSLFDVIGQDVPFPLQDMTERQMRVLIGNIKWMKRPHYAYVGSQDQLQEVTAARRESTGTEELLKIYQLPGDHHTSLAQSAATYAGIIKFNP